MKIPWDKVRQGDQSSVGEVHSLRAQKNNPLAIWQPIMNENIMEIDLGMESTIDMAFWESAMVWIAPFMDNYLAMKHDDL